jgi:hypothetical protein
MPGEANGVVLSRDPAVFDVRVTEPHAGPERTARHEQRPRAPRRVLRRQALVVSRHDDRDRVLSTHDLDPRLIDVVALEHDVHRVRANGMAGVENTKRQRVDGGEVGAVQHAVRPELERDVERADVTRPPRDHATVAPPPSAGP